MDRNAQSKDKERTYSVVITTLQSQSLTLSLRDSALNPANTAEWTAPIRAQARKAAVACHVIGRLGVSLVLSHIFIFTPSSLLVLLASLCSCSNQEWPRKQVKKRKKERRKEEDSGRAIALPLPHSLDRNSIPLLNPPRLEYISNLTSLLHQFPKTDFSRFGSFIRFVDYSCFFWVGVEMSV